MITDDETYPRPQLVRHSWTSLDGVWDFAIGTSSHQPPTEVRFDQQITVPFPPESRASGLGIEGFLPVAWYRCYLDSKTLSQAGYSPSNSRLVLHFNAADYESTVWLNGQHLGDHIGGHTPFSFDVTDILSGADQPVELMVRVLDDPVDTEKPRGKQDWQETPHVIWYGRTTGIWQPVWLEATPCYFVQHINWNPQIPDAAVEVSVEFNENLPERSHLHIHLEADDRMFIAEHQVEVSGNSWNGYLSLPCLRNGQALDDFTWTPETPRLVHASLELTTDMSKDCVNSYFGLRSVGVSEESFLLNGRPYFIRGVMDQGYWPDHHLASPASTALRQEVELIKKCGFNTVRIHQKIEDPRFLYWADRLGLMVWSEAPSAYTFSSKAIRRLMHEWSEVIHRDASHPSIVAWVPLNESWGVQHISSDHRQRAYAKALSSLTRALDPSRPVISNDGWEHIDSDILTIHDYSSDANLLAQRYGTASGARSQLVGFGPERRLVVLPEQCTVHRPVVLSEFGGISFNPKPTVDSWGYSNVTTTEQFEMQLRALILSVTEPSGLAGFCFTQLTDTRQETNGLLYEDRSPKIPFDHIHAAVTAKKENSAP